MATRGRINIRVNDSDRELFDRAADVQDENLTQFLVRGGQERAERLLADRTNFTVDADDWNAIIEAMERPATPKPELADLFSRPRPE
ncbi:MAG: DUF1778 domain-containing protein [Solirubrobacterales bacterium]|nr:DUF1778 domain-containing protein [Solirubrobacterales bacterium]